MNARGLLLLLSSLVAFHLHAAEFQVHTNALHDQEHVALTQLANGTILCAWEDEAAGVSEIRFRQYDSNLVALGTIVRAHPVLGTDQAEPAMAPLPNGFVIVWAARNLDGSDYGIAYRRFDASGNPVDAAILQANTTTAEAQLRPQVAALSGGGFIIVWTDQSGAYSSGADQDVRYRRFNANGTPLDASDLVANAWGLDAHIAGNQGNPAVAALIGNGFVIVYEDRQLEDVFAVRFDGLGNPLQVPGAAVGSRQMRVNQAAAFDQWRPAVSSFPNGAFVVTFNGETNGNPAGRRVLGRMFDPNGTGGNELVLGSFTNRTQDARVAALADGTFVATMQALNIGPDATSNSWSVLAQRLTTNGAALSPSFIANAFLPGDQERPGIGALRDGSFLLAWQSFGQDGDGYGVYAQRFTSAGQGGGRMIIARQSPSANLLITFADGAPYVPYRLQATTNLVNWVTLRSTNTPGGVFQYLETQGAAIRDRFYRVATP